VRCLYIMLISQNDYEVYHTFVPNSIDGLRSHIAGRSRVPSLSQHLSLKSHVTFLSLAQP
jgi:hypothetical protein